MFGKKEYVPPANLPGRNDPCHCKSGKKYKKCCEAKDEAARHVALEKQWSEAEKTAAKKAQEEKEKAAHNPNAPPKPTQQPRMSEHRHNTRAIPKFNMPRRIGGG